MATGRARLAFRLLTLNLYGFNRNSSSLTWYKSKYSLDKLYPTSSLNFAQIPQLPIAKNDDKFTGYIPMDKIQVSHCRSSGPGGQNVNKVNSKVEVRFHLTTADWIPEKPRTKLMELFKSSITKDGFFIIKSEKTKSQSLNLADCLDKIRCFIREAEKEPGIVPPETKTLIKERQARIVSERLRGKRHRSLLKDTKIENETEVKAQSKTESKSNNIPDESKIQLSDEPKTEAKAWDVSNAMRQYQIFR